MLRRWLLVAVSVVLVPGAFAFGAQSVAAKPGKKSPRLHAFRSCSNLLGYAQRHGVRVIRDSFVFQRGAVPPPAALEGGGAGGLRRLESEGKGLKVGDKVKVRCHALRDGSPGCLLGFLTPMHGDMARGHGVEKLWD